MTWTTITLPTSLNLATDRLAAALAITAASAVLAAVMMLVGTYTPNGPTTTRTIIRRCAWGMIMVSAIAFSIFVTTIMMPHVVHSDELAAKPLAHRPGWHLSDRDLIEGLIERGYDVVERPAPEPIDKFVMLRTNDIHVRTNDGQVRCRVRITTTDASGAKVSTNCPTR